MIRLAADENFNDAIIRGALLRMPDVDVVRVQDAALSGADDPTVVEWAARENRVLLTHDVSTMTYYALATTQEPSFPKIDRARDTHALPLQVAQDHTGRGGS
jgi:predicted nuclease of predicted toxin-antitoxin system